MRQARSSAQVLEELLIVRQHDELPGAEAIGEQLCQTPAMFDVEAVDHVVEQEKSDPLVEAFGHGEQRDRERVQVTR